ncbi:MAG TPA: cytochrome P450 [Ktedonobacterales bacterium]
MASLARFDPFLPEIHANPYPFYAQLREHDPLHWGMPFLATQPGAWYVSRYEDVVRILKDPAFVKNQRTSSPTETPAPVPREIQFYAEMARHAILLNDPPDHTRLRKLVSQAFTPRTVERMRAPITASAQALLDAAAAQGEVELLADFAFPLTLQVIAAMIGVPDDRRDLLSRWSRVLIRTLDLAPSLDDFLAANQVAYEAFDFFHDLLAARRAHPADDLLSHLIAAHDHEDRLSEDELIVMCSLLLVAGFDTTVNLIGNGALALLQHPDQLALLREHPELLPSAIEELLRYEPSTQKALRYAATERELHGKRIGAGQAVIALLAAANRDPAVFPEPDRLDITRAENRHLGFGTGIHICLGAPLARLEGQIAISMLLRRFPRLALVDAMPAWRDDLVTFRRLARLPVAIA